MKTATFISNSEAETRKLAARIARNARKNDCMALIGSFGSGKTVFVKGLAEGLAFRKKSYVCSPSFVILKIYRARMPIYHFDLYRLGSARDFEAIGLHEFMTSGGVSAIEWADKIRHMLPKGHLKVEFSVSGARKRKIKLSSTKQELGRFLKRIKP